MCVQNVLGPECIGAPETGCSYEPSEGTKNPGTQDEQKVLTAEPSF